MVVLLKRSESPISCGTPILKAWNISMYFFLRNQRFHDCTDFMFIIDTCSNAWKGSGESKYRSDEYLREDKIV